MRLFLRHSEFLHDPSTAVCMLCVVYVTSIMSGWKRPIHESLQGSNKFTRRTCSSKKPQQIRVELQKPFCEFEFSFTGNDFQKPIKHTITRTYRRLGLCIAILVAYISMITLVDFKLICY